MLQKIRTALCSYGMSGKIFHGPFLHAHPGFELVGAWERSRQLISADYPSAISYSSYEALLADSSIELVVVNTPNYTHADLAKKALLAGKHILVEKPFTVNTAEAEELIRISREQGKSITVYHNRRWDSDYLTVKKILDQKLLGDIVEAEIHFDRYNESISYKQHKETPGPGANVMYDLGSHLIDQALQLFGWPEAVFADNRIVRPVSKVDDYFELLLYYPQLRVRLRSTYCAREAPVGYVLHGLKGSFIKPKTNVQENDLQAGKLPGFEGWGKEDPADRGLLHTEKDGQVTRELVESEIGNYLDLFEGLYQSVRNGKPVPVNPEDGMAVIRIIEAAYKSSSEQRVIHV